MIPDSFLELFEKPNRKSYEFSTLRKSGINHRPESTVSKCLTLRTACVATVDKGDEGPVPAPESHAISAGPN